MFAQLLNHIYFYLILGFFETGYPCVAQGDLELSKPLPLCPALEGQAWTTTLGDGHGYA